MSYKIIDEEIAKELLEILELIPTKKRIEHVIAAFDAARERYTIYEQEE
jgi:hypothetical protein